MSRQVHMVQLALQGQLIQIPRHMMNPQTTLAALKAHPILQLLQIISIKNRLEIIILKIKLNIARKILEAHDLGQHHLKMPVLQFSISTTNIILKHEDMPMDLMRITMKQQTEIKHKLQAVRLILLHLALIETPVRIDIPVYRH